MKTSTDTARSQTPQDLVDDLKALVAEAEALIANSQSENSDGIFKNLRARFGAAQESCADFYGDTKQKVVAGAKHADTTIRENPYQSLAIAAGMGLLVGVLLRRRSQ